MILGLLAQLVGFALSITQGILLVQVFTRRFSALTLVAGSGIGFGLSSAIWFLTWCTGASRSPRLPISVEVATVFGLFWLNQRLPVKSFPETAKQVKGSNSRTPRLMFALAAASGAGALFFFVRSILRIPHGGWDAWAIWNLHAHAFFVGGGNIWQSELSKIGWSHPDYPLLIPLNIVRLWFFSGTELASAPASLAFFYTFGTAALLFAALDKLKGRSSALVASSLLLASTNFLWVGAQEYADVPLSFYFLLAVASLEFYGRRRESSWTAIAGLSIGFAVWTKNEGWMFLGCLLISSAMLALLGEPWRMSVSGIRSFIVGALPPIVMTILYRLLNPAHSDVAGWYFTRNGWSRIWDVHRLLYIGRNFTTALWRIETWGISAIAVLAIYALLVGTEPDRTLLRTASRGLLTIGFMVVGYLGVYVTSTSDLNWYLHTSLDRLFIQIWPAMLLLFSLVTRTPYSNTGSENSGSEFQRSSVRQTLD